MPDVHYQITHDPALLEAYFQLAADVMCNEIGLAYLPDFYERGARVGYSFPLVALDGDRVVGGIMPVLRHEGNQDILIPEEHGTESRLQRAHARLARRFAWSNHAVVHPDYRRQGIFEELSCHLFTVGVMLAAEAMGVTCVPQAVPGYIKIAAKYGMHGEQVDVDFVLPGQYAAVSAVFFLIYPEGAALPAHHIERLRAHCARYGIAMSGAGGY